jgi:hypothetical protein
MHRAYIKHTHSMQRAFYLASKIFDVGAGERGVIIQMVIDVCQRVEGCHVGDEVLQACFLMAAQV